MRTKIPEILARAGSILALIACVASTWTAPPAIAAETSAPAADAPLDPQELVTIEQIKAAANLLDATDDEAMWVWGPLDDLGNTPERTRRITQHMPEEPSDANDSLLPRGLRITLLRQWAKTREAMADFDGARETYETVIGLGGGTPETWHGLARTRVRSELHEGGESAYLTSLALIEQSDSPNPLLRARLQRELAEVYLQLDWPAPAATILEQVLGVTPGDQRTHKLWAYALTAASGGDIPPELSVASYWSPTTAERWQSSLDDSLNGLLGAAPAALRSGLGTSASTQMAMLLGGLCVLLGLSLVLIRGLRKHGDLVVTIAYPDELVGEFSVRLSKQQGRFKRAGMDDETLRSGRRSDRWNHYSVSRETHFQHVPAGRYYVTVYGALIHPETGEPLTEPRDEQSVDITGNESSRRAFDLSPTECPVDVKVRWDKQLASQIGVSAKRFPQATRYASSGEVRLRLPMGSHTIIVGSGDRVAERDVEVDSFKPISVEINLADSECLVFKGCPPAVEPYLRGDLVGSASALERDGHANLAHLLMARMHQDKGQIEMAAEQLESAGHTLEAAKLRESISDFERAAALFEDSGNAVQAAETYRSAGEHVKAGELYQSVGEFARAEQCFREAGATIALVGVLEMQNKFFEAAEVARESGDRARSIRLLQQIGRPDPSYSLACMELVEAFEHEGHADLAANKLEEYITSRGPAATPPEIQSRLADLLIRSDEPARALEALEELRRLEPTFPEVASRIEALRKQLSSQRAVEADGARAATQLVESQRYEVIEEIGRGGMGLIYKARDRRLNRVIALKRLPENLQEHPKAVKLFLNEAQAAARLNHVNIVTVFDTDQEDGMFYITMELLEGLPLNVVLRQRGRLGPRDTARIGAQVAKGLQYAHEQQVVHRDIKTANLFFSSDKVVKIMDFGLAKVMEEVRRGTTVIGGTPSYMAPEQAAGANVDHRADIYALGVTLFELVTGNPPFTEGDVAYHHRHTPAPDPRTIVSGLPEQFATLVLQMLEKDRALRPRSAAEVERRLEEIVNLD